MSFFGKGLKIRTISKPFNVSDYNFHWKVVLGRKGTYSPHES